MMDVCNAHPPHLEPWTRKGACTVVVHKTMGIKKCMDEYTTRDALQGYVYHLISLHAFRLDLAALLKRALDVLYELHAGRDKVFVYRTY